MSVFYLTFICFAPLASDVVKEGKEEELGRIWLSAELKQGGRNNPFSGWRVRWVHFITLQAILPFHPHNISFSIYLMLLMHNYNNCLLHLMRADIFLFISRPLSWAGYLKKSATQEIWKVRGVIIWKYGKWAGEESQTMRLVFDMPRKSESLYQDPGDSSLSSPLRQVVLWSKWEASKIYHRSRYRISWCCVWLFNVDSQKHNIWKACLPNWMVLCL